MCAWRASRNFSASYKDALNSEEVRQIAVEVCNKANPPIQKKDNHVSSSYICPRLVRNNCSSGESCGFSHHPSRGMLQVIDPAHSSPEHVKVLWRTDYRWQLWALAFCGADKTEFHCASDGPHGKLRDLVRQLHSVAENIAKEKREVEQDRERQLIAEYKANNELKEREKAHKKQEKKKREAEAAFDQKVAVLATKIMKEMGDNIHELDEPLFSMIGGLTKKPPVALSTQQLTNLTASDLSFDTDNVDLVANLLTFLWESKKLSRLERSKLENGSTAKIEARLAKAQISASTAEAALNNWMEKDAAQEVTRHICSVIASSPAPQEVLNSSVESSFPTPLLAEPPVLVPDPTQRESVPIQSSSSIAHPESTFLRGPAEVTSMAPPSSADHDVLLQVSNTRICAFNNTRFYK